MNWKVSYEMLFENNLDPNVWIKKHNFFVITMILQYPRKLPNDVIKRKYYTFFMNLDEFVPESRYKAAYKSGLDRYPISPFLDSRENLFKWYFILSNYIFEEIQYPRYELGEWIKKYHDEYTPPAIIEDGFHKKHQKLIYGFIICFISVVIYMLYQPVYL